ncbi:MAG: AraC family transcriptional regulator [Pirellulaceae bacterium]
MNRQQQVAESIRIYRQRVLDVQRYIEQHLGEHLTVENLSRVACFSEYHFHRIFAGLTGEPLMGYVKRLRLERSAALLSCTELAIAGIAIRVGYETAESFARAFRQQFGVAPTQYRSTFKKQLMLRKSEPDKSTGRPLTDASADDVDLSARVTITTLPRTPVAFIRHVGPYWQAGRIWQELLEWLGQRGLPLDPKWAIAYDEPEITPHDKLRYDACVEVTESFEPESGVGMQFLAGGTYAVMEHRGPIQTIGNCYRDLYARWMPFGGFQPRNYPPIVRLNAIQGHDTTFDLCVPVESLQHYRSPDIKE